MKNLIIKSTIITLSLILIVGTLFILVLSFVKPSIIANTAFNLNNKEVCVKYSEKQFLKSGSVSDLKILTERSIWASDDNKVVQYASKLLSHNEFINSSNNHEYENYIASSYAQSLYKIGNKQKSVEVAFSYYDGITTPNTIRVLVYNAKTDKETLNLILQKLNGLTTETNETSYLITEINKLL